MQNIEDLKKRWSQGNSAFSEPGNLSEENLSRALHSRIKKNNSAIFKYFWGSFAYQIVVYGFLGHVIVRFWTDYLLVVVGFAGVLLYIPFTTLLLKKYKKMAFIRPEDSTSPGASISDFVAKRHAHLLSFYKFKKKYELILVPLIIAIFVWMVFRIYVPGGVNAYFGIALACFIAILAVFAIIIIKENKKHFKEPLNNLKAILDDLQG